ncbi:MAG TPA: hypothetical protein VGM18_13905 [Candidatus Sulfotelmatobacter sp.]
MSRLAGCAAPVMIIALLGSLAVQAQMNPNERAFPQSKATVEKALKAIQANLSGRLPSLEGFASAGEHGLDQYQRGFYQATVQVSSTSGGGSLVLVSVKVTAWYIDPVASHSGYQLLTSNGRLEADLLDQLADQLAKVPVETPGNAAMPSTLKPSAKPAPPPEPTISAPARQFPETGRTFPSSVSQGLAKQVADQEHPDGQTAKQTEKQAKDDQTISALRAEADSLEEILKNQGHPKNLVAVKKSGTPVVGAASLTAKPLFLASQHDEFEMLDFTADWVHVRISGLSRGWIWRNSVEMPDGIPDTVARPATALVPAADLFHVIREETASFPGDWEPLRGKTVKIVSVQKIDENAAEAGPKERLEYAKFLFDKSYTEMSQKPQDGDRAGIVVIFDSADGGMIAATLSALQQWRAGALSDAAFWHKCFFDPPEALDSAGSPPASE